MSWMKRPRASPGPPQGPGQNIFNPTQPPMPGQPMQQQQQWAPQQPQLQHSIPQHPQPDYQQQQQMPLTQQQYWQPAQQSQPPSQPQQPNAYDTTQQQHNYQQQNFPNEYYQYNKQYPTQPGYQNFQQTPANVVQPVSQQHGYQQQNWEQNATQKTGGDAWDWGWQEDATTAQQTNVVQQNNAQQQLNANIIANSFSNAGDSWNWSVEEQHTQADEHRREETPQSRESSLDTVIQRSVTMHAHSPSPRLQQNIVTSTEQSFVQNDLNTTPTYDNNNKNIRTQFESTAPSVRHLPVSEPNIKSLSDKDALMEHNNSLPNMAVTASRRYLNDSLTPQWSTESQPSQDSSDGLLTESTTNRSEDPSTKSSPSYSQDNTNFNYPQSVDNVPDNSWDTNHTFESVQTRPPTDTSHQDNVVNQELVEGVKMMSFNRASASPSHAPILSHLVDKNLVPPNLATPPSDRNSPNIPLLPPSNKKPPQQLPPTIPTFPQQTSNSNPFKRSGQLSHKTVSSSILVNPQVTNESLPLQQQASEQLFNQQEHPHPQIVQNVRQPSPGLQSLPLTAPRIVQQQNYSTANLETTPENSERPDIPPPVSFRPMMYPAAVQGAVENFEIAPSNDRNEYLQTRHLSDNFTEDNLSMRSVTASQESFPPPGLRRMVLGQPESEFNQSSNDELPPGLSRMVPGQLNDSSNIYAQPVDDFLDRQIDGQTTESESLNSSYMNRTPNAYNRVGDGQPTDDESNFNSNPSRSSTDRRPVGLDRMVPGESSSFQSFQNQSFPSDTRVVTGFDQIAASERRDQNMDGSDYSEIDTTSQIRSIVGVETVEDRNVSSVLHPASNEVEINQRELNMEGENLQDLSNISSTDFSLVRDQHMDGADIQDESVPRATDAADSFADRQEQSHPQQVKKDTVSKPEGERKYHNDTTGDESERDRYNRKNKREKERMRSSRERDSRYSGDKREDRRGGEGRGDRDRDRDDDRSYRRGNRDSRYETEDTDYFSDKERRRHRDGHYSSLSKPPRPERRDEDSRRSYERSLRDTDRDARRHRDGTRNKDESPNYDSDRDGYNSTANRKRGDKDGRGYDDRDGRRHDRRDGYTSLRKSKAKDDRKRDSRYPPRPDSRDPDPTEDDDPNNEGVPPIDLRGRSRHSVDRDRQKRDRDRARGYNQYYDTRYGGYDMDPYSRMYQHHQQTYQYYEKLRLTNPQAYMEIYAKYMSGQRDAFGGLPGYDQSSSSRLGDERGSVHSGQSSTNGEALKDRMLDTSFGGGIGAGGGSNAYFYPIRSEAHRHNVSMGHRRMNSGSIRTDVSDSRDGNSINLTLDNSTVKSERMTPVKFATAHIKGIISSTNLVTVNPSYPIDGQPAIVEILDLSKLLVNDPMRCELAAYPGPLIKGTTHKKTVIEYCETKIREAVEKVGYSDRGYYIKQQQHQMMNSGNSNSFSDRQTLSSVSHQPNVTDVASYVLMWELLILLLRQNGVVVGTDIAELLVKNKRQFEWRSAPPTGVRNLSRRGSNSSVTSRSAEMPIEEVMPGDENTGNVEGEDSSNDTGSKQRLPYQQQGVGKQTNVRRTSSHANILESPAQEKYVTDKFTEYLLFGNGKEALEWAMSHGLWGHALFLASKLDKRTYANVMMRFANGLAANDPLQTLYQLMSGRQPASVTCVLDDKWGDWRPHLAMILSNTTQKPELDKKSITTLGDTLLSRGDIYAAHFCYLMAREEPSSSPGSHLQLLGLPLSSSAASHNAASSANPYKSPTHNIIMTEIYEYACSLNQTQRPMGHFQFYKYLMATRLVDCGLYERALLYTETISEAVQQDPHQYQGPFLQRVLDLAERLKFYDPEENFGDLPETGIDGSLPGNVDGNRSASEKPWLASLRNTVTQISSDPTSHPSYSTMQSHQQQNQPHNFYQQPLPPTNVTDGDWSSQPHSIQQRTSSDYDHLQNQHQDMFERQYQQNTQFEQQPNSKVGNADASPVFLPQMYDPRTVQQEQNNYMSPLNYEQQDTREDGELERDANEYTSPMQSDTSYWNQDQHQYGYHENTDPLEAIEQPRPQLPYSFSNSSAQQQKSSSQEQQAASKEKKDASAKTQQPTSGWFGGIFNKLSLKPKNQMILPDDKNPSIVWDSENKKWVNLDSDEQEREANLAPPPKMSDIMRTATANINNNIPQPMQSPVPDLNQMTANHTPNPSSAPPPAMPNIFKLQKSRHIKKAYVDVFNPSGAPMKPLAPASEVLGDPMMMLSQTQAQPTNFFVPGQVPQASEQGTNQTFYNPADY